MKIYPFLVSEDHESEPLANVLTSLMEEEQSKKNRSLGSDYMRIGDIETQTIGKEVVFVMDFIRLRMTHGPAKGGLESPIEGFDLEEDQGFCEETAAMYVPSFKLWIVQYNFAGIKSNRMVEYLSDFYHDRRTMYRFTPIIRQDIVKKLDDKAIVTKMELKLYPSLITDEDRKKDVSLKKALEAAEEMSAGYVTITLGSERSHELNSISAKNIASWVLNKITQTDGAVDRAKITGKNSETDPSEILDLMNHRLYDEADLTPGIDRRFTRDDRWNALIQSFLKWKQEKLIYEEP